MTDSTVVYTDLPDSKEAGEFLGTKITEDFEGRSPDALIVFASSRHDYAELLQAIKAACRPKILVGCSSAGEFTCDAQGDSAASAVALRSSEMHFAAGVGHHLRDDREAAAREIVSSFTGLGNHSYLFRSALVLTDALAGYADDLIEALNLQTAGTYMLFGGGAGDDAQFTRTHVFHDTEAIPDAAVALEILSNKPLGIGVSHGWVTAGAPMRVTEAEGMRLISLNAMPALEVFEEHAASTGQEFDLDNPVPFFLHNIIGIDTGSGHKLRVPLAVH
ncbi:MAG TPA: FIST N-terminal domain-containing protein, partial [Pyrinomonadaceae bacterium]|nr:FIST N-terminal domain-containing protein [Pyrinomonadaceae bacterium]